MSMSYNTARGIQNDTWEAQQRANRAEAEAREYRAKQFTSRPQSNSGDPNPIYEVGSTMYDIQKRRFDALGLMSPSEAAARSYGAQYGGTGRTSVAENDKVNVASAKANAEIYDPFSKYRGVAAAELAKEGGFSGANDPANFYRDKLKGMADGSEDFVSNDPSYKFRFAQGQQAAERSLASRGLLNSGNAALELQSYGQGMASQEYGAQFNRMLSGLEGVGKQYDNQQKRLMEMAGVSLDPTAGAKLDIAQQEANTRATSVANDYSTKMKAIDAETASNRYNTDSSFMSSSMSTRPGTIDVGSLYASEAEQDVASNLWWTSPDRITPRR